MEIAVDRPDNRQIEAGDHAPCDRDIRHPDRPGDDVSVPSEVRHRDHDLAGRTTWLSLYRSDVSGLNPRRSKMPPRPMFFRLMSVSEPSTSSALLYEKPFITVQKPDRGAASLSPKEARNDRPATFATRASRCVQVTIGLDQVVERTEDCGDPPLIIKWGQQDFVRQEVVPGESKICRSSRVAPAVAAVLRREERQVKVGRITSFETMSRRTVSWLGDPMARLPAL